MAEKELSPRQALIVVLLVVFVIIAALWFVFSGGVKSYYKLSEQLPAELLVEYTASEYAPPFAIYADKRWFRISRTGSPVAHKNTTQYGAMAVESLLVFDDFLANCGSDNFGFLEETTPFLRLQTNNSEHIITYELSFLNDKIHIKLSPLIKGSSYGKARHYLCDTSSIDEVVNALYLFKQQVYGN